VEAPRLPNSFGSTAWRAARRIGELNQFGLTILGSARHAGRNMAIPKAGEKAQAGARRDMLIMLAVAALGVGLILFAGMWGAYSQASTTLAAKNRAPGVEESADEIRHHHTIAAWQHFLKDLGVALVIASVVGLAIDWTSKRREAREHEIHRAEIEVDVFKAVFGFGVHKEVLQEFMQTVLVTPFMRTNLTLVYKFEAVPASFTVKEGVCVLAETDLLRAKLTVSYQLHNMSDVERSVQVLHYFENVLQVPEVQSTFLQVSLRPENERTETVLKGAALQKRLKREGIRCILDLGDQKITPGVPLNVRYTYSTIRRRRDSELWVTTYASDGFTIQAVVDRELANLEFCPDACHRFDPEPEGDSEVAGNVYRWTIKAGVLPSQGVILYWRPTDAHAGEAEPDREGTCQGDADREA
jgi:hypothetical protein